MNSDFSDLLSLFTDNQVRYLIVGGYAVIHYSEPRFTKDLDLWVEPSVENARRVAIALTQFGVPLIEVTEGDLAKEKTQFRLGIPPTCIDIFTSISGLDFCTCWTNREEVELDGLNLYYVGMAQLMIAKETSGRPQDLADLEKLKRIDSEGL